MKGLCCRADYVLPDGVTPVDPRRITELSKISTVSHLTSDCVAWTQCTTARKDLRTCIEQGEPNERVSIGPEYGGYGIGHTQIANPVSLVCAEEHGAFRAR